MTLDIVPAETEYQPEAPEPCPPINVKFPVTVRHPAPPFNIVNEPTDDMNITSDPHSQASDPTASITFLSRLNLDGLFRLGVETLPINIGVDWIW